MLLIHLYYGISQVHPHIDDFVQYNQSINLNLTLVLLNKLRCHIHILQKPTDLDLHCLQRQSISGFSRTRVKIFLINFVQVFITRVLSKATLCVSSSLKMDFL